MEADDSRIDTSARARMHLVLADMVLMSAAGLLIYECFHLVVHSLRVQLGLMGTVLMVPFIFEAAFVLLLATLGGLLLRLLPSVASVESTTEPARQPSTKQTALRWVGNAVHALILLVIFVFAAGLLGALVGNRPITIMALTCIVVFLCEKACRGSRGRSIGDRISGTTIRMSPTWISRAESPAAIALICMSGLAVFVSTGMIGRYQVVATNVTGNGMAPSLIKGDHIVVDQTAFRWDDIRVDDIVTYQVGRDIVRLSRVDRLPLTRYVQDGKEKILPPGYVYLVSDSPTGADSAAFGPIDSSTILGRVQAIYWPPSRARMLARMYSQ